MAKPKSEKTEIQKKADAAREAYSKAKEADEKNSTAATKKALSDAAANRETAVKAEARERFQRVGGTRVNNGIKALENIGKMNAPRSYNYTEEDIAKAEAILTSTLKNSISALRAALTKGGAKTETSGFSF